MVGAHRRWRWLRALSLSAALLAAPAVAGGCPNVNRVQSFNGTVSLSYPAKTFAALADRLAIGEVENLELPGLGVVRGERVAQPADGVLTEQRQHEAGAGTEFLDGSPSRS